MANSKPHSAARMIRQGLDVTVVDQEATRACMDRARGYIALLRAQLDASNAELARLRAQAPLAANDSRRAAA